MKQIIVHCEQSLTSVAFMDNGHLIEYYADRPNETQLVGDIYLGRVVNVLPGMQAAFVDIGQGKNAFLYIDDLLPAHLEKQPKIKPQITELLTAGQEIMVQIAKEPLGTKGARVTTHFSIPGRSLVYMPYAGYVAVSRKIEPEEEKNRLREIGEQIRRHEEGMIIRTVAKGKGREELQKELLFLRDLWENILRKRNETKAPSKLYGDLDMILRVVRDIFTDQVDELLIDDPQKGADVINFVEKISPALAGRVHIYREPLQIFERYAVNKQIETYFRPKVWLNNGGYIIIEQTEALTVVDVNTGKYTGSCDLERTVFATNLEAAELIARLLRLRDIGGIIIVDFIDMNEETHRKAIVEKLEEALKADRTKCHVVGWTNLGLLEITRKKVRENIENLFTEPCPHCGGTGKILTRTMP
jgi:ribonuclease G